MTAIERIRAAINADKRFERICSQIINGKK